MKRKSQRQPVHMLGLDVKFILSILFSLLMLSAGVAYATESATPGAPTDASAAATEAATDTSSTAAETAADTSAVTTEGTTDASAATDPEALIPQGVTAYDVWVGGVQVTDANKDDVLAGTANAGFITYDPSTTTLTLGDGTTAVSISGVADKYHGAAIQSTGDLIINTKSSVTLNGASCETGSVAGVYVEGNFSQVGQGVLTVTAGAGLDTSDPANFSAGIYATGDIHIGIESSYSHSKEVHATGGSGSPWSIGIWSGGVVEGYYNLELTANGAGNPGGYSVGVRAQNLNLHDEQPVVYANGGIAATSAGVFLDASATTGTTVIDIRQSDALYSKGGAATLASYGIHCANSADIVTVCHYADLEATAGTADTASGTSIGIFGQLNYDNTTYVGSGYEPYASISSNTAATSKALSASPTISGEYRWLTDTVPAWQYSGTAPYVYSGSERLVTLKYPTFPVWVGTTRVTAANMNDVLGDGTVTFTPAYDGKSLGTLSLRNAHVKGGIAAEGAITINLTGDSTVDTTKAYDEEIVGVYTERSYRDVSIKDYSITVTGTGSLAVTASAKPDDYVDKVTAIRAGEDGFDNLTICDSARVTATATNMDAASYGVSARNISLSGSAVLEGLTSVPEQTNEVTAQAWGIMCSKLSLTDSSKVVGRGCDAYFESYGITVSNSATVANNATLIATSGSATGRKNDGYSFGLSGDTWESGASFVVTGGTVDLESGNATTSMATDLVPDLSGYASYRWKTAAADELTASETTAYVYDKSQTYIKIVPPASKPTPETTPVTPAPVTPAADKTSVIKSAILPNTGDDMTAPLAMVALALTGTAILVAGLACRKKCQDFH